MSKAQHKELALHIKAPGGAPSEDDIALINQRFAVDEQAAEDLMVREFLLATNAIDRDGDIFDRQVLEDFAATLPGKGLFIMHPMSFDGDTSPGEGLFFRAEVKEYTHRKARSLLGEPKLRWAENDDKAYILHAWAYVVRTAENEALLKKLGAGVARYVSIGFTAADREPIRDGDGNVVATRILPPAEAYEGSLVWLGSQRGARAIKQPGIFDDEPEHEGDEMKLEEQIKSLAGADGIEGAVSRVKSAFAQVKKLVGLTGADNADDALKAVEEQRESAKAFDSLRKALGDNAGLLNDPEDLQARVEVATKYRDELLDDIVRAERQKGLIEGDDEETVKQARKAYEPLSIDKLKALRDRYMADIPRGQLEGGDPNATGADPKSRKAADDGEGGGLPVGLKKSA